MIPLVRPVLPKSIDLSCLKTYSNFGEQYSKASKRIEEIFDKKTTIVSNGTVAITIALESLKHRNPQISECLVPEFAPGCTIAGVVQANLKPIVMKCSSVSLNYDIDNFKSFLKGRSKSSLACVIVNPFGYGIHKDVQEYLEHELNFIVYDSAGSWPSIPNTRHPITMSLHATKTLGIGEGGLILNTEQSLHDLCIEFSNFSYTKSDRVWKNKAGQNAKIDEIRCLILNKLLDDAQWVERIKIRKKQYQKISSELSGKFGFYNWMESPSLLAFNAKGRAIEVISESMKSGIMAIRYYYPLLTANPELDVTGCWFNYDSEIDQIVALPSDMNDDELNYVISFLAKL